MGNTRIWIEAVLYGAGAGRRFTQDSPVLPDVWVRYLEQPLKPLDLLIEPWLETPPSQVAGALLQRLKNENQGLDPDEAAPEAEPEQTAAAPEIESADSMEDPLSPERGRITYNRTMVVSRLKVRDLVLHVLPLTSWYRNAALPEAGPSETLLRLDGATPGTAASFDDRLPRPAQVWHDVVRLQRPINSTTTRYPYSKILSLVRIAGLIGYVGLHGEDAVARDLEELAAFEDGDRLREAREVLARCMVSGFRQVIGKLPRPGRADLIYTINRNRKAALAIMHSIKTVKADAASSLFSISCKKITWAVIDSGIDARHPAFVDWSKPNADQGGLAVSRVKETYDFSYLRELLLTKIPANASERCKMLRERLPNETDADYNRRNRNWSDLVRRIRLSRAIDWELLLPMIQIPHSDNYIAPADGHGTHVAGILGADWWEPSRHAGPAGEQSTSANGHSAAAVGWSPVMRGLCPDIKLIDIRVCRDDGTSDEFVIMSEVFERKLGYDLGAWHQHEPVAGTRRRQLRVRPDTDM
jgi:subtilisin family serine protease